MRKQPVLERHPGGTGMLIQKKLNRDAGKPRLRLKQAFSLLFACLMILQTGVVTAFAAPSASVHPLR